MRIAYLLADPGIGVFGTKGASVHVQEMVRAFRAHGHHVTVYCIRRGDKKGRESVPADLTDLDVVTVPVTGGTGTAEREAELRQAATRMARLAADSAVADPIELVYERYALFCDAGARLVGLLAGPAAPVARPVPLILEVNAPLVDEQRAHRSLHDEAGARELTERSLAAATVVSCVSAPVASWVRRTVPEAAGQVLVIPNGVNTDRIRPAERTETTGAAGPAGHDGPDRERPLTVGFVGTLKPWHGTEMLLQAVARTRTPHAWRIEFCGAGPQLESLRALAQQWGLETQTFFHGAVAPDQVPEILNRWDVATAPYPAPAQQEDHYFSPLKVYEYLAAGLAVVASDVGELPAVLGVPAGAPAGTNVTNGTNVTGGTLRVGECGVVVTGGDPQALARALDLLAADPALTARLGAAGRAAVVAQHTWTRRCAELLELVEPPEPIRLPVPEVSTA